MSSTSPNPGNTGSASAAAAVQVSDAAWEALQGGYDLQVHVAPDVIERRIDDLDLAKEFLARGLRGFVLKSHYFPTAERAKVVSRAVPGISAYGAITLNHSVGGLNPVAIELAGRSGCKIVWMPTVDAANETAGRLDGPNVKLPFWAKIQRELAATGIAPPPPHRTRFKRQSFRSCAPLHRTDRKAQHDSCDRSLGTRGNFPVGKDCSGNGGTKGVGHPRRVSFAEPYRR